MLLVIQALVQAKVCERFMRSLVIDHEHWNDRSSKWLFFCIKNISSMWKCHTCFRDHNIQDIRRWHSRFDEFGKMERFHSQRGRQHPTVSDFWPAGGTSGHRHLEALSTENTLTFKSKDIPLQIHGSSSFSISRKSYSLSRNLDIL